MISFGAVIVLSLAYNPIAIMALRRAIRKSCVAPSLCAASLPHLLTASGIYPTDCRLGGRRSDVCRGDRVFNRLPDYWFSPVPQNVPCVFLCGRLQR